MVSSMTAATGEAGDAPDALSSFEFWPPLLFYAPITAYWFWLALRHRSLTLPSLANPALEAGGLWGESKRRSFRRLCLGGRSRLAPWVSVVTGRRVAPVLERALVRLTQAGIAFPIVAKPDIGCNGAGVRLVASAAELADYIAGFPRAGRILLQRFVAHEGEAGIFYVRRPDEAHGRITSLTLKYFPTLTGDGHSSVEELVRADARAGRIAAIYLERYDPAERRRVPRRGEAVRLCFVGNHCRGAIFRDGTAEVTPAMEACFDRIAHDMPGFYYGRFDVRFRSLTQLQHGEGFEIIEVNGAGSEPTHIWDRATRLRGAYAAWCSHLALAFEIGREHRARGLRPASARDLVLLFIKQRQLMRRYPPAQ
jgi:hypothetical protein